MDDKIYKILEAMTTKEVCIMIVALLLRGKEDDKKMIVEKFGYKLND